VTTKTWVDPVLVAKLTEYVAAFGRLPPLPPHITVSEPIGSDNEGQLW
jgi:hypothetical protein